MADVPPVTGRIPLDLAFKGERGYLQGPDLLAALLDVLARANRPAEGALNVAFYRKTARQPDVCFAQDADGARPETAFGRWSAQCRGGPQSGWFLESARPVERRVPYDEDSVVALCRREAEEISFDGEAPLTAPELAVAMTKALHNARFPLPSERHWVVSQFALTRPLTDDDRRGMRIRLNAALGTRLTRSTLFHHSERLGDIFFAPAPR